MGIPTELTDRGSFGIAASLRLSFWTMKKTILTIETPFAFAVRTANNWDTSTPTSPKKSWRSRGEAIDFEVFIKDITGGEGKSFGVNLLIIQAEPGIGDQLVKNYLNRLIRDDPELEGAKIESGCLGKLILWIAMIAIGVILYFYFTGRK